MEIIKIIRGKVMKINKCIAVISGFISFFMIGGIIYPYDNKVAHRTFNEYIIKFAEENFENYFPSNHKVNFTSDNTKYKGIAVTEGGWFDITEKEEEHTILDWIIHGGYSADEPEVPASVRHFYDPVELVGVKYLTNEGTVWENHYPNPHTDAIEWAMGDTIGDVNKWTLLQGKEYLVKALEATDEEIKNTNFAKAFRCLGEVLHNTGDMGCPAHTRNDSHAAPIGYTGGAIFGSPDPYEELFLPSFIQTFWEDDPDPDLKSFFDNATTIRSINEKLAEFTNANFFTEETINGLGYKFITPINVEGTYPSPLLQDFDYNSDDYTYSKILPYNNFKIIMAKDKSFLGRTYPYIDRECVRNQAEYLVPNIICAGANVVRLFIPQFEVKIKSASSSGEVEGIVIHKQTGEYTSEIAYSGKIFIYDNKTLKKIGDVSCQNGEFSGTVSNLGAYDEIYAELEMAGINIRSEIFGDPECTYISDSEALYKKPTREVCELNDGVWTDVHNLIIDLCSYECNANWYDANRICTLPTIEQWEEVDPSDCSQYYIENSWSSSSDNSNDTKAWVSNCGIAGHFSYTEGKFYDDKAVRCIQGEQ
ncbi:MAG: hypothetical protein HKO91_12015 [Desulfobacterales bacterium]|nr:hypothetical protein [Desulfobacterales bacterium]